MTHSKMPWGRVSLNAVGQERKATGELMEGQRLGITLSGRAGSLSRSAVIRAGR
jgi:hypothetical protein